MKVKNDGSRIYSLMVGEDLEIVNENGSIMVLDKGVIMCVTDNWRDAIDFVEQQYTNNQKIMVDKRLERGVQWIYKINLINGGYNMERIYEFLSENGDFGYRVYIANDKGIYMSFEDAIEYLEDKEVEVDYIEPDNSAIELIVDDKEVSMIAL